MNTTKALLLSAGFGTRLKPITNNIPKCLVEVNEIPMLEHWLNKLENLGIKEVLINIHYLADQVIEYIKKRKKTNLLIKVVYENNLLGTAGTLIKNKDFFLDSDVLFIHVDNFTNSNLKGLFKSYREKSPEILLTMLTFKTEHPEKCGVLTNNDLGVVTNFYEKVKNPPSRIANGAIYLFNYTLIDWILNNIPNPSDFSNDVLPNLMNKINVWNVDEFFIDIGTPKSLEEANNFVNN